MTTPDELAQKLLELDEETLKAQLGIRASSEVEEVPVNAANASPVS